MSPELLNSFDQFGFLHLRGFLADRIDAVIAAFEEVWQRQGGGHFGKAHDGKARSCVVPFIDQSDELSSLLDDPRITDLVGSILGDDFTYLGSDGNYYVGETPWHRDGFHRGMRFIKIAIYLDKLDGSSGALRVIPGSHRLDDVYGKGLADVIATMPGAQVPAVVVDSTPGDIAVFDHNLYHASFNGGTRRRMFTLNLCQRWPEARLPELQEYIATHARFWIERNVGPRMLATATPQRMRHLQQAMENDFLLTERTRKMKAEMSEPSRG